MNIKEKKKNPMDYYLGAFKKYAVFSGRAQRAEYWYFTSFNFIIGTVLFMVNSYLGGIYSLIALIPVLAVTVRRLHDVGKSAWMLLIFFIPLIGPIWLLILEATDSNSGDNEYGSNPKEIENN